MTKQISEERKSLYQAGLVMQIIGGCLFALPFITIPIFLIYAISRRDSMMVEPKGIVILPIAFGLAFIGFALIAVGGFMRTVAARGKAGSGLVLDPRQAREDVEPWSRMQGGVIKDTLDEAGIDLKQVGKNLMNTAASQPQKIVMIKCPNCSKLNEEDSKFCQECGKPL